MSVKFKYYFKPKHLIVLLTTAHKVSEVQVREDGWPMKDRNATVIEAAFSTNGCVSR